MEELALRQILASVSMDILESIVKLVCLVSICMLALYIHYILFSHVSVFVRMEECSCTGLHCISTNSNICIMESV